MGQKRICCPVNIGAIPYAAAYLQSLGFEITDSPDSNTSHLLLPVPSFSASSVINGSILSSLPQTVVISGGNLDGRFSGHRTVDFLKDPDYLAENAAITARCAIALVEKKAFFPICGASALVIGWGRIGKCLQNMLVNAGADVTVAARKDTDRAMIRALGCRGISIEDAAPETQRYDVILNTVPAMVFPDIHTKENALLLELASAPGMSCANIISARGLPGKMAPEESGKLIAKTFIRLSLQKEE